MECDVLDAVAAGKTNRDIAEALGLSLRAVEDRRTRLMRKFEAKNAAESMQKLQPPSIGRTPTPQAVVLISAVRQCMVNLSVTYAVSVVTGKKPACEVSAIRCGC